MGTDGRTDGRTGRHGEANSRISQFCEGAVEKIRHKLLQSEMAKY